MTNSRCTVRTFKDNGPYFTPTIMQYSAESLKQLLFHTRLAMEDQEDIIAVFHDDRCIGLWHNEPDIISDGEGSMVKGEDCFVMYRNGGPNAGWFNSLVQKLR